MSSKIAVAIIHGVGTQNSNFAEPMIEEIKDRFAKNLGTGVNNPKEELVIEPIHWAPVLQSAQNRLWRKVNRDHNLDYIKLRRFMIDFAGDAIAYQPTPWDRVVYDAVHCEVARSLKNLANRAGPKAPLCVIAHSLGTVIASNYFYDMARRLKKGVIAKSVKNEMGKSPTPLERGETFSLFYTLGSPLAIWSLRYQNFGTPIAFPAAKLATHHPGINGEWVNYFDPDDVIGYPLKPLNDAYKKTVTKDVPANVGGILSGWTPASHTGYWTDNDVTIPISKSLANTWRNAQ